MNNAFKLILTSLLPLIFFAIMGINSNAQTEGFDIKNPIQKITDSTTKLLNQIIKDHKEAPKKSIPEDLVCSAQCFLVIPNIEMVESRGDFTGTGLMACRTSDSDKFTEPLFYKINNLHSFEENGGGLVILATDKAGMKAILGNEVHLNSENTNAGPIGKQSEDELKSFAAYVKYKDQTLSGFDLSGSLIEYSSKDTFNAYQGTIVPIDILISPQDVPPMLRDFQSLLAEAAKDCNRP